MRLARGFANLLRNIAYTATWRTSARRPRVREHKKAEREQQRLRWGKGIMDWIADDD